MVKKEHKCHHLAKIVTGRVNNSRVSRKKWRNTGQQWSRLFMKCQMYCCWHVLTWTAEFVQIIASLKLHKTAALQWCKSGWNDTDWYDNDDNVITRQTDMMEFVNRITSPHRCLFEKRADSIHPKRQFLLFQNSADNLNFPQKDSLRTRKLSR